LKKQVDLSTVEEERQRFEQLNIENPPNKNSQQIETSLPPPLPPRMGKPQHISNNNLIDISSFQQNQISTAPTSTTKSEPQKKNGDLTPIPTNDTVVGGGGSIGGANIPNPALQTMSTKNPFLQSSVEKNPLRIELETCKAKLVELMNELSHAFANAKKIMSCVNVIAAIIRSLQSTALRELFSPLVLREQIDLLIVCLQC
jgi:hypothetical protein